MKLRQFIEGQRKNRKSFSQTRRLAIWKQALTANPRNPMRSPEERSEQRKRKTEKREACERLNNPRMVKMSEAFERVSAKT